jgi:hypothetical protein
LGIDGAFSGIEAILDSVSSGRSEMDSRSKVSHRGFLLKRRSVWWPRLGGWALLIVVGCGLAAAGLRGLHPFLALNNPVDAQLLVVEGWTPDYLFRAAVREFKSRPYRELITTGGLPNKGRYALPYPSLAAYASNWVRQAGLPEGAVAGVMPVEVSQDDGFNSALGLRKWIEDRHVKADGINVVSEASAARKTRLVYQRVLGPGIRVGVIPVQRTGYDPRRWWISSEGVRTVIEEAIGYLYLKAHFSP